MRVNVKTMLLTIIVVSLIPIIINTSTNYVLVEKKLLAHKTKRYKEK